MYKKDQIYDEIISIIEDNNIYNLTDIFKHTSFGKNVFYQHDFNKDVNILKLIKENRKVLKTDLLKNSGDEIARIKSLALDILTEEKSDPKGRPYRVNTIIYRIDFLCVRLHISTATFYDYGLNKDIDIRRELDMNRETLKIGAYSKLFNSHTPVGVLSFLKLIGTEEERKKLSTTYQEIKDESESIKVTLADEIKELLINASKIDK